MTVLKMFKQNSLQPIVNYLIPALLFFGVFFAVVATIDDYGLIWDEPYYIENAKSIEYWFANAASDNAFFSPESIGKYWTGGSDRALNGNAHPPFYKLSAIAFRYIIGTALYDNIVYQYRVSTAFWTAILVVILFIVIRKFTQNITWALLGGFSFITAPRFFADAHFFATDMIVTSLGFSGLAVFIFASNPWIRIILGGALFGAALASKFTGILAIAIVAPLIIISDNKKLFVREYSYMVLIAIVCFSLFNLPMLFYPYHELSFYCSSFFGREKIMPISTIYFGEIYSFNFPLHQPWIMFGITLPPLLTITAVIGFFSGILQFMRSRDRFALLSFAPFLMLMGVYMLPSTPKHDGIRLFSSAWPFVVLMSIFGCYWIQGLFNDKFKVGMSICVVSLLLTAKDLRNIHPYELSYYNQFIGGTKGAQEKGFTVSYWGEAFNKDFFRQMVQIVGNQKSGIYSWPNAEAIISNQTYGLYPIGLRTVSENEDMKYILVLNRFLYSDILNYTKDSKPLIEISTQDGAYIGGLYQTY